MKKLTSFEDAQDWLKHRDSPVVLVPTMGALHAGHTTLVDHARKTAGPQGTVLVSIYLNPTQFDRAEDLEKYPRALENDLGLCEKYGADAVFAPADNGVYLPDHSVFVDEYSLAHYLCGASRPGHFRGVCTIVAKLFAGLRPDAAIFGKKDFQQLAIIRRLVRDLNFPIEIQGVETVREADGLALSSRNGRLTPDALAAAPGLYQSLLAARQAYQSGTVDSSDIIHRVRESIECLPGARIDYVQLVNSETLEPENPATPGSTLALAVFFGSVRLIDNIQL